MTVMLPGSDAMSESGEGGEPSSRGTTNHYDHAYEFPPSCQCDDVTIDVVCEHLGIPVHPLADVFGDHMTRQQAETFEANWRRTYGSART